MDPRRKAALRAALWAAGAIGLSHVPWVVGLVPSLGVLRGPLGPALAALGGAVALAHLFGGQVRLGVPRPLALYVFSAVVLVGAGLHYASRLRVSGDEPHYLLMAQSLWREGDLDLRDNFERGDYREYLPALPAPHYGAPRADGRPFPGHGPGLPALLAPIYAAGGRGACVVLFALLAAALALEVARLAEGVTGDPAAGLFAWAVTVGPPVAFYAFHIYTEVPSALALALALRLLLEPASVSGAVAAALLASALPWLHVKMIPAAAALGLVALARLEGPARLAFLAVAAAMAACFLGYFAHVFGSPSPLAAYGGLPHDVGGASPWAAAAGLLLDRSYGLLTCAPVFLLALPGLLRLRGGPRGRVWPHVVVGAAVLAPLLSWRMWWGGQCPPARFLVPLVPLLAVAVAARVAGPPRGLARWRGALLGLGLALTLFAAAQPEQMLLLNRRDRPTRIWDALSAPGGTPVQRYLPSLVYPDPAEHRVAMLWIGVLALLLLLDSLARRRDAVDRAFSGLALPLALLLLVGVLVDGWARAGPAAPPRSEPTSAEEP